MLAFRTGRDRRYAGSAVDVAFGNTGGDEERVPLHNGDPIPVEFVPPDGIRPGQVGTLIDEQANPLDVTATIIDLAVRGYLQITEIPKEGWFSKPDWQLHQLKGTRRAHALRGGAAHRHLQGRPRRHAVRLEEPLRRPGSSRWRTSCTRTSSTRAGTPGGRIARATTGTAIGVGVLIAGVALTFVLAKFTSYGLIGIPARDRRPVVLHRVAVVPAAHRQGLRHAAPGPRVQDLHRRVREGPGPVRRAAAPVLGVPALRRRVRRDREVGQERSPASTASFPQQNWYIGPGPFTFLAFSSAMDSFAVTSTGTISSVPASSGSSGFGGGGFSGGGFGGGGGGSW